MRLGLACMLGVVVLWSAVPVLVKLLIPVVDPYTIAFMRLAQGTAVVLAAFLGRGHRLRSIRLTRWHLLGGLGVALNYALFARSLSLTTASAGVLIVQVQYVTLALLAAVVLGERLGPLRLAGMVGVLCGVALIVASRGPLTAALAPRYALGNVVMLFSGIGWGVYALANKALTRQTNTLAILLPMLAIGTTITGLLSLTHFRLHAAPGPGNVAGALALGILATGGAFILVSEGMQRLSAALAGTATTVTPIGQILLAHWVLAEPVTWGLVRGGALILAGVITMVYAERRRHRQPG